MHDGRAFSAPPIHFDVTVSPSAPVFLFSPARLPRTSTCVASKAVANHFYHLAVSISPDGRTLLCVGDTPDAYLFNISPGPVVTFSPLATYTLPAPPFSALPPSPTTPPVNFRSLACFTTAWSADGLKFAVASQEGQLCVWDVRSARPLFTFWTTWRPNSTSRRMRLGEWEWEDLGGHVRPSDDATNNGPDSGIRNVRFSAGEGGRELMVFTEVNCRHVIRPLLRIW
jgi:WD40 repeat protein